MFIYCEKKTHKKDDASAEHGRERAGERERDGAMSAVVAGAPSSRASAYADWSKIGEGTFGVVYRAKLAGAPPPFRPASAARGEEEGPKRHAQIDRGCCSCRPRDPHTRASPGRHVARRAQAHPHQQRAGWRRLHGHP